MKNVEKLERHEAQTDPLPTTLNLFRFKGKEREALRSKSDQVDQFSNNARVAMQSLDQLVKTTEERKNRLSHTRNEFESQIANLESSATCSLVFLKLEKELPHLSSEELLDLFILCLNVNVSVSDLAANEINAQENMQAYLLRGTQLVHDPSSFKSKRSELITKISGSPPKWFNGNKKSWDELVLTYSNFPLILDTDPQTVFKRLRGEYKQGEHSLGILQLDGFPDWLEEETITSKNEVQQEFDEDMDEVDKAIQKIEVIDHQKKHLTENFAQKRERANAWIKLQTLRLFPQEPNLSFWDQVLTIHIIDNMLKHPYENRKYLPLPPEGSVEKLIQEFTNINIPAVSPEPVALFLEKALKESGLIKNATTQIDDTLIGLFDTLTESLKAKDKEDPAFTKFQSLKDTNKKVYKILNYDIKPFLTIMTQDEISYLRELLVEYKGFPIELFIWDIAEIISSHFRIEKPEEKEQLKSRESDLLRKPTATFLRKHWNWLYEEFGRRLNDSSAPAMTSSSSPAVNVTETVNATPNAEIQEIQSSIQEIKEGNLADWTILYTTNRSTDPNHLVQIGGTTIDEREQELENFFRKEDIDHSIKTSSIMHVLESLPLIPEEVEWMAKRKMVNGEEFKKKKRGKGRIFYILDSLKKTIIFFYVEKKAWNYGF